MLDKSPRPAAVNVPNDLAAHWMPFTANRAFKKAPRLLAGAKDMHYITVDGRKLIDAAAGMWCTNAGHGRTQISEAIAKMAATLDYAPPFQFGIPQAFELASRIAELAPKGLDHVFSYVPSSALSYKAEFGMSLADYKKAWDKAYALGDRNDYTLQGLARMHREAGSLDKAANALEDLVAMQPDNDEACAC